MTLKEFETAVRDVYIKKGWNWDGVSCWFEVRTEGRLRNKRVLVIDERGVRTFGSYCFAKTYDECYQSVLEEMEQFTKSID